MELSVNPTAVQPKSSIDSNKCNYGCCAQPRAHYEHSLEGSSATTFSTEVDTRSGEKAEVLYVHAGRFQRFSAPFGTRWRYGYTDEKGK